MISNSYRFKKEFLAKLGLLAMSLVLIFFLIEISLRSFVEDMPLKFHKYLPTDVRILAQSSKSKLIPESYIALFGDSYAAGWGDWYRKRLDAPDFDNPPYHSGHIIHELLNADVLSFAQPGRGSFAGLSFYPIEYHKMLRSRGFLLPDPKLIIVYFYEGNDFDDNITFLTRYWHRNALLSPRDFSGIVRTIKAELPISDRNFLGYLKNSDFLRRFYVVQFLYVLARDIGTELRHLLANPAQKKPAKAGVGSISVRVGNENVQIPGPLEAPPIHLGVSQITNALNVLEESLRYIRTYFKKTNLLLVHIPSPMASYELQSNLVPIKLPDDSVENFPSKEIASTSDRACAMVADVASRLGIDFFDVRKSIRAEARTRLLHGPTDWWHFNRAGYEVLGAAVATYLQNAGYNFHSVENKDSVAPKNPDAFEYNCHKLAY